MAWDGFTSSGEKHPLCGKSPLTPLFSKGGMWALWILRAGFPPPQKGHRVRFSDSGGSSSKIKPLRTSVTGSCEEAMRG